MSNRETLAVPKARARLQPIAFVASVVTVVPTLQYAYIVHTTVRSMNAHTSKTCISVSNNLWSHWRAAQSHCHIASDCNGAHLHELLLCIRRLVHIRVELGRHLAVCFLDLLCAGILCHAQHLVQRLCNEISDERCGCSCAVMAGVPSTLCTVCAHAHAHASCVQLLETCCAAAG